MKSPVAFLFLLLICIHSVASENKPVTTCTDYTPWHLDETGKKVFNGRNIETLLRVVETLSLQLDTSIRAPFVRCMKLLEQNKIDVIAGLIYTEERAQKYTLIPYRKKAPLAIFYLKSDWSEFDIKMLGKTEVIGMHRAFALPENIKNSALAEHLTAITSVGVGMEMLLKGRLSGVLATVATGELILSDWPDLQEEITYSLLPSQGDDAVYLAIHPESPLAQKQTQIKEALELLAKSPEYQHLDL